MRKYYVDFAGREASRLLKATPLGAWKAMQVPTSHELVEIFEGLGREAVDDSTVAHAICTNLMRLLLLKITQRAVSGGRGMPRSLPPTNASGVMSKRTSSGCRPWKPSPANAM